MDPYINVRFISSRLSLPLFMVSRNQIRFTKSKELRKYFKKNSSVYLKCIKKEFETATSNYWLHIVESKKHMTPLAKPQYSKFVSKSRKNFFEIYWKLPPNRYDTNKVPYINKRGIGGAYWPKEHSHQSKLQEYCQQSLFQFNNLPTRTEKIFSSCSKAKGVFLSNARERRATSRCMISNLGTCYKDPLEPGPTTYNPTHKVDRLSQNLDKPNPYLFYRLSTVPVKQNSIHIPHTSFSGAPGRYEIRYSDTCPCSSKLIYQPQIDLIIEKEKRKKFRRLAYITIKARDYCSPDWRHVKGKGFRYLFKGFERTKSIAISVPEGKKVKNIQLYPDSKYIGMINNPSRKSLSLRPKTVPCLTPYIKFNCVAKKVTRKQLRINKKIAFNSSQERFRDSYRLPILTHKQQELIKQSLPLKRQLQDYPIMDKRNSEIKSKLYQTPKHMLPIYEPTLRKKKFKFQPLPELRVLLTENDTKLTETLKDGYYLKNLKPENFFKNKIVHRTE